MTRGKPELLPSAVPSARDFFSNGKDQSLKLVQRSSCSSAGMDGAALNPPGTKTFPWGGIYSLELPSSPGWVCRPSHIPVLEAASWQCPGNPKNSDFINVLGFRPCFHANLGVGFSAPQIPCFQKSPSVPLLRFNAASIPKFQTWLLPAHHFDTSNLHLFIFPPLFLQEDESLCGHGITSSL